MKQLLLVWVLVFGFTAGSFSAGQPLQKNGTNDFTGIAQEVIKLLESGDAEEFARSLSGTKAEWDKLPATGRPTAEGQARKVFASATRFIEVARELGVDSSKVGFTVKQVNAGGEGSIQFSAGSELPYIHSAEIILAGEPKENLAEQGKFTGEYTLAMGGLIKLEDGWRLYEGISWKDFPQGLENKAIRRELRLLSLASSHKPLTGVDDPAFAALGETFIRLLQTGDTGEFLKRTTVSREAQWNRLQERMKEHNVPTNQWPSRTGFEKGWKKQQDRFDAAAKAMLAQAEQFGIVLKGAQMKLKAAEARYLYAPRPGTVEELSARNIVFAFDVQSPGKAKSGKSISGQYVVRLEGATWQNGRWNLDDSFGWRSFPEGVVDEKALKELEFENHVAEHGTLPPGTAAPDIEFTLLEGSKKAKLADYRGQVVFIDFWATWCGPCQAPMAELQELALKHPEWKGKAMLLALSIDSELPTLQKHLTKHGWTNSVNAWAGKGGWEAPATTAFRVRGVPTSYIIDKKGKVLWAGHPSGAQLEKLLAEALKE